MKIAIVGTHSTGKTTLVNKLDSYLTNGGFKTVILPELSRLSPYPINERTNFDAQAWIQENHIKFENETDHLDKILICDRSTLDNFAYFERAITDRDISGWEKQAVDHMNTYDLIFKTRKLDLSAPEDGVRSTEDGFRTDIDRRIARLFYIHGVSFNLLSPTIDYSIHLEFIKEKIEPLMRCELGK